MPDNHSSFGALVNAAAASASLPVSDQSKPDGSLKRSAEKISTVGPSEVKSAPSNPLLHAGNQMISLDAASSAVCAPVNPLTQPQQRRWPPYGYGGAPPVKTRRVPCKARNMGDDHSAASAYFDIPLDAKHGTQLICSHPTCAGSGRRFRYCIVCELPVAKRNFVKRHSHGLVPDGDPVLVASHRMAQNTASSRQVSAVGESAEADTRASEESHDSESFNQATSKSAPSQGRGTNENGSDSSSNIASPNDPRRRKVMTMTLSQQEFQWLALLHSRPNMHDTSGMQKWMVRVIDSSEPNKMADPIAPTSPCAVASGSAASVGGGAGVGTAASVTEQLLKKTDSSPQAYQKAAQAKSQGVNNASNETKRSGVAPTRKIAEEPKKNQDQQSPFHAFLTGSSSRRGPSDMDRTQALAQLSSYSQVVNNGEASLRGLTTNSLAARMAILNAQASLGLHTSHAMRRAQEFQESSSGESGKDYPSSKDTSNQSTTDSENSTGESGGNSRSGDSSPPPEETAEAVTEV